MARTRNSLRSTRIPWHAVLVLSLQNPTADEIKAHPAPGATTRARSRRLAAAVKIKAFPAPGETTRARSRRIAAAVAAIPEEILAWEIFLRLPSKDILRCRAVCRYWHGLTSAPDFLLAHHRRQPSFLLVTLFGKYPIFHNVERGNTILGLRSYSSKIHASWDGLLLLSLRDGSFRICNPGKRQCAPLPNLTSAGRINTAALYLHRPSGEYRIRYWKGRHPQDHPQASYYILTVRPGCSPRSIGVPSDAPAIDKAMLAWNETGTTDLAQPIEFRNCLHWEPSCLRSDAGILIFDTVVETFRLMCRPAAATRLCNHLCDMEGLIGFSCFSDERTVTKIWVLEDYERQVWSFKYSVKFPLQSLCKLQNLQHTKHLVLSHKGDVLVYSQSDGYMFHYDNTGKLLEEFRCDRWSMSLIGPGFKESLVNHDFFLGQECAWIGKLGFFVD